MEGGIQMGMKQILFLVAVVVVLVLFLVQDNNQLNADARYEPKYRLSLVGLSGDNHYKETVLAGSKDMILAKVNLEFKQSSELVKLALTLDGDYRDTFSELKLWSYEYPVSIDADTIFYDKEKKQSIVFFEQSIVLPKIQGGLEAYISADINKYSDQGGELPIKLGKISIVGLDANLYDAETGKRLIAEIGTLDTVSSVSISPVEVTTSIEDKLNKSEDDDALLRLSLDWGKNTVLNNRVALYSISFTKTLKGGVTVRNDDNVVLVDSEKGKSIFFVDLLDENLTINDGNVLEFRVGKNSELDIAEINCFVDLNNNKRVEPNEIITVLNSSVHLGKYIGD